MHIQILTLLAAVIVSPFALTAADTALSRELDDLQKLRAKALADAVEPINRKHQAALQQLLRRATQASDLETAVKVKELLSSGAQVEPTTGVRIPEGTWKVEYSNGKKSEMVVGYDGRISWSFIGEKPVAVQDRVRGPSFYAEYKTYDFVELWTMAGEKLLIEHWSAKASYDAKHPANHFGYATRVK